MREGERTKRVARAMVLAVAGLAFALASSSRATAAEIRIGVFAVQGSEKALADFEPTRAHLERSLAGDKVLLSAFDLKGLAQAVADKRVDFVVTNPSQYVELEFQYGVTRIATLETEQRGGATDAIASTVIALQGPQAPKTLSELIGRRLAVSSKQTFGGYEILWRELDDLGASPSSFASILETGFPMERVVQALRDGRADAGVLRSCLLEDLIADGRVKPNEFAIVGERSVESYACRVSTRLYPDWPFARTREAGQDLTKRVAAALLSMPAVSGRAWTAPLDYTTVHALLRQLKIAPYAYLAQPTLTDLLRAYWQYALAALLVVGWWILHVQQVERLVRRRTAELEREIGERERAEQEARINREQRDQFSRLGILGEMASNIAHELNQPLAAIANYAEGMTRMIDAGRGDSARLRDGARGVAGQAERAAAIIQRIRAFVRRREARRDVVDPNDMVRDAVALFEGLAARRGVALRVDLSEDAPAVLADPVEIQQVLLNILQNAVDAIRDSQATSRDGVIVVRTSCVGADAEIAVCDFGPGLTPEVEAHLFETFFTTKPQGLGLGLSICRTIIESHGGRLWAAANDDAGLTMRFTLPGAPEEP